MYWVWASLVALLGLAGPILTIIGLPGTWLLVALMLLGRLVDPPLFTWWTIGICASLALLGEVLEMASSAVAVRAGKGTRRGMIFAIIGGIIGAIVATPFPPPIIATLVGGMLGAGAGAIIAELSTGRALGEATRTGGAAAAGKLAGTLSKSLIAVLMYVILAVAAFWP
ncbi:MAG: DUF456 family protein [Phycisphaerales bacterium]|nr:DUF456 family protein [Phycisphaerales bacterium]